MIERARAYLLAQQDQETGGWCVPDEGDGPEFPAISGLVVQGLVMAPDTGAESPGVSAGVKYLLDKQQEDGGVYVGMLPSYNTAISLTALSRVPETPRIREAKERALAFLRTIQYGEAAVAHSGLGESAQDVSREHAFYGGFGYGRHGRPDLSNTAFAVEAMRAMKLPDDDPAFERVLVFLQRCQMQERIGETRVNDMAYARGSDQGGFIYATSVNKDVLGVGQSPAGEIAESLDDRSGSSARVRLGMDGDKPRMMTRERAAGAIREIWSREPDTARGIIQQEFMIILGPTGDGMSASEIEVRATIPPGRLEEILREAFSEELGGGGAISAEGVEHWRGTVRHRAYGTMTYAGLKSYLYAGLTRDDPRVLAAKEWIASNYTLEVNPGGMGTDGLYYYFLVFARAHDALGEREVIVKTPSGASERRVWARDLVDRLEKLQNTDGSFRSVDNRWMEDNPVLITAYALIALEHAREH
jgi:hypothetical protein